jgi:hypothetical protein
MVAAYIALTILTDQQQNSTNRFNYTLNENYFCNKMATLEAPRSIEKTTSNNRIQLTNTNFHVLALFAHAVAQVYQR